MDYRLFNINLKEVGGLDCRKQLFFKRPVYAVVSIVGNSPLKQRTSAVTYCGQNSTWDQSSSSMKFYVEDSKLQQNHLVLMVQILRRRIFGGDKVIGEVCVPFKELYDNSGGGVNITNHSFQQIVKLSGCATCQGFLYFTYEFGAVESDTVMRKDNNGAIVPYPPLVRSHSRVIPSAPLLEYLGF